MLGERVSVKEKLAEKKDAVIKMNAGKEHSAPEKKKEAVIQEEWDMYTTGDKLLNVMKEEEIGIAELARISGVLERTYDK